jgi:hypothetical protein
MSGNHRKEEKEKRIRKRKGKGTRESERQKMGEKPKAFVFLPILLFSKESVIISVKFYKKKKKKRRRKRRRRGRMTVLPWLLRKVRPIIKLLPFLEILVLLTMVIMLIIPYNIVVLPFPRVRIFICRFSVFISSGF